MTARLQFCRNRRSGPVPQQDGEGGAPAQLTFHFQCAAVDLHNGFRQRQPQPDARRVLRKAAAVESLEQMGQVLRELETHCVDLTQETIEANKRFFDNNEDLVPKEAYTMGIKTIMQARKVLMVANGVGKADIIKKAFFGPVTPEVPASILQMHPDFTLVLDAEAASKLD